LDLIQRQLNYSLKLLHQTKEHIEQLLGKK